MKLANLLAAGRRHNANDVRMLQQMHDHAVSLGATCKTAESDRDPAFHLDAAVSEALGMSHGDLANLIRMALRAEVPNSSAYIWVRDVYDDAVVYEYSPKDDVSPTVMYQRSYSILDGVVSFGDPMKVIAVTNYVPVAEAGDPVESDREEITGTLVPLVEKAVKKDGTIALRIIAPGQGSSGYYPSDVLQRDGPKVFTSGLHMHLDHPSISEEADRPERSVTTLAGHLTSDARWDEHGAAGPGLYADAKVRSDLAPLIEELAPQIGVSIRALGKAGTRTIDGKKVRTIEGIDQAKSVDFVTIAGAGGKVLDLVESARSRQQTTPQEGDDMSAQELDDLKTKLAESERKTAELERWKAEQERKDAEAKQIAEARRIVVEALSGSRLTQRVRDRLTGQLAADPPLTDGAVDRESLIARVKEAETEALAEAAEINGGRTGQVWGMGGEPPKNPETPTLEESSKRIEAALKGL